MNGRVPGAAGAVTTAASGGLRTLPFQFETRVLVHASADAVFAHLDDHTRLSAHMTRRSWMMAGSRMDVQFDAGAGRAVGSTIRMSGRVLGIRLELVEMVTERQPPLRKVWETVGPPRLLVIGPYRMGFEVVPQGRSSGLTFFIDYALPDAGLQSWLARMLGPWYARWCTRRMAKDAMAHFR
jgi:hypothetical protein